MIDGLATAARLTDAQSWEVVTRLLGPTLARRWADERFMLGTWDADRVVRSATNLGRGAAKPGFLGRRRRQ
jgi:hypothetical protein